MLALFTVKYRTVYQVGNHCDVVKFCERVVSKIMTEERCRICDICFDMKTGRPYVEEEFLEVDESLQLSGRVVPLLYSG